MDDESVETRARFFSSGLLKHLWALMGCAAFTLIGIVAAAQDRSNKWVVGVSAATAAVFFVAAAYKTWADEHGTALRYKTALDGLNDLRPVIWGVSRSRDIHLEKPGEFDLIVDTQVKEPTAFGDDWSLDIAMPNGVLATGLPGRISTGHTCAVGRYSLTVSFSYGPSIPT